MTDAAESDTGLQAERTALSWRRTALSAMCLSAVLAHHAAEELNSVSAVSTLASVAVTALLLRISAARGRALLHSVSGAKRRQTLPVALAIAVSASVSLLTFAAPR